MVNDCCDVIGCWMCLRSGIRPVSLIYDRVVWRFNDVTVNTVIIIFGNYFIAYLHTFIIGLKTTTRAFENFHTHLVGQVLELLPSLLDL